MRTSAVSRVIALALVVAAMAGLGNGLTHRVISAQAPTSAVTSPWAKADFHDSHFHLTNYIQEGINVPRFLEIMGSRVGRSTLFGIPLQQTWSFGNSGDFAPTYYLHSDAPLYYYSFTDAFIARAYQTLTPAQQARFDPMITGFNPADMYAADHIRRVLRAFPGVFSGIGEFSTNYESVGTRSSAAAIWLWAAAPARRKNMIFPTRRTRCFPI